MRRRRTLTFAALFFLMAMIAAALTPDRAAEPGGGSTTEATGGARAEDRPPSGGRTVPVRFDDRAGPPRRRRVGLGDLVQLEVRVRSPASIELEGYDEVETADPQTPARFELVADRAGRFAVRLLEEDRVIGRLVVGQSRATTR